MYQIKSMSATGLHRFDESQITIPQSAKLWMITGKNLDSNQSSSNGAGKTGVPNIVSWVLTGFIPGKESEPLTIGGTGKAEATIELVKGEDVLTVTRVKNKSGTKLFVHRNGEDLSASGEGQKKPQDQLNEYLGIPDNTKQSFEGFLNTVYLTFNEVNGFADAATTSADRINLLTKYLSLERIDVALKELRRRRRELDIEYNSLSQAYESAKADTVMLKEVLQAITAKESELQEATKELESVKAELMGLQDVEALLQQHLDLQQELHTVQLRKSRELDPLRARYNQIAEKVDTLPTLEEERDRLSNSITEVGDIESELETLRQNLSTYNTEKSVKLAEMNAVQRELQRIEKLESNSLVCPSCDTSLLLKNAKLELFDIKQVRAMVQEERTKLIELREVVETAEQNMLDTQAQINKTQNELTALRGAKYQLQAVEAGIDEILKLRPELDRLDEQGLELSNQITAQENRLQEKIAALLPESEIMSIKVKRQQLTTASEYCKDKISRIQTDLEVAKSRRESLLKQKEKQEAIRKDRDEKKQVIGTHDDAIKHLPRFRSFELDKSVPVLEGIANEVLQEMGTDFRITLEINVTSNRTEFPILVADESNVKRAFGTYSNGERQRIAFACAIAQRIVAQSAGGYQMDFMFMDEVLDGLDTDGREALIYYLMNHPGQHFIITHGSMGDLVKNEIKVTRKNGVSSFNVVN